jgi:hypothetical protein
MINDEPSPFRSTVCCIHVPKIACQGGALYSGLATVSVATAPAQATDA